MRDALAFVALLPVLAVLDLAFWLRNPERRLVRTAREDQTGNVYDACGVTDVIFV